VCVCGGGVSLDSSRVGVRESVGVSECVDGIPQSTAQGLCQNRPSVLNVSECMCVSERAGERVS
jgi:hypothetical protein